ncbi:hypothetical protein QR680_017635 [Steinernema hermaphroditum]|uniref:Uncharacterized protein n=1 Tax=Steinernema hermaphroditum TaxID=289476 RepID=A0AA39HFA6_9BILA|nr:hypothetical protein QR680_017635 [Steinernema hermaphroditum]
MSSQSALIRAQFKARRGAPPKKTAAKKPSGGLVVAPSPKPTVARTVSTSGVAPKKPTPLRTLQPNVQKTPRSSPSVAPVPDSPMASSIASRIRSNGATPMGEARLIVQKIQRSTNPKINSTLLTEILSLDLSPPQIEELDLTRQIGLWKARQRVFFPVAADVLKELEEMKRRGQKRRSEDSEEGSAKKPKEVVSSDTPKVFKRRAQNGASSGGHRSFEKNSQRRTSAVHLEKRPSEGSEVETVATPRNTHKVVPLSASFVKAGSSAGSFVTSKSSSAPKQSEQDIFRLERNSNVGPQVAERSSLESQRSALYDSLALSEDSDSDDDKDPFKKQSTAKISEEDRRNVGDQLELSDSDEESDESDSDSEDSDTEEVERPVQKVKHKGAEPEAAPAARPEFKESETVDSSAFDDIFDF